MWRMFLVLAAALTTLGLTVAVPSAGAATGTWTLRPGADPGQASYSFARVSCSATTACTAVGYAAPTDPNGYGPSMPLAERWDGASWSIQSTPVPAGTVDSRLEGVSCWTAFCTAVGYTSEGFNDHTPRQPLAMSWDGTAWTLRAIPLPAGAVGAELHAVSCLDSVYCKAVGDYTTTGLFDSKPFALTWNGSSWTVDNVKSPAASVGGTFFDVSCGDFRLCAAVGYWVTSAGKQSALAESWNGTTWHVDGAANPGNPTTLLGVSCYSHTACTAVGSHATLFGSSVGFAERRAGSSWASQGTPNIPGATLSAVQGIACRSAQNCVAVGYAQGRNITAQSYGLVWGGLSWKRETPVYPAVYDDLTGVSCPNLTYCMTVGTARWPVAGEGVTRTS